MDYLLFRLYGPLASWGNIAIGESRHSFHGPTKSAVMGLVAAALGIRREEESQHLRLNREYHMASALFSQGSLLRDYHTVQAPDTVGKFTYRSRRDELVIGKDRLGTVLSSREYRSDALAWVALRAEDGVPYTLEQIADGLRTPIFTLYLGRKSCPLAAPLDPQLVVADGFAEAFKKYQPRGISPVLERQSERFERDVLCRDQSVEYCWEGNVEDFGSEGRLDKSQLLSETQHDRLNSRRRWQYAPRQIYHYRTKEGV
ncbi:type I-E CRISPR-associated protein Cas5/CasD [Spongiibacter taiwanensis]|uniref:type I-E CRISPR-associated protein Cas5/CasD n=1 Tax=Spongiibacter taiwanensis TaxID=1748242 RepID=UPI002034C370|nr:type I-E CRISPR-associated protein Cas5/CasD [Spongiibacter taiwanensis]USA43089.1 type I-E CRISPR-associated protein Cas5/CasD [Spongiibacter taiwanensis]